MVCLFDVKEQSVTVLMWVFTIILGVGVLLSFMRHYGSWHCKKCIDDRVPLYMTAIGLIGATLIGMASGEKREGFKSLYGL